LVGSIEHLFPVLVDSILLFLAGAAYTNIAGKRYPNKPIK